MLLAEANQWPIDVRPYFGEGDECQMAFHFPLMPRIYMAISKEDRFPITETLRQTPEIPGNCQWALFLRNHDELTLEMVTSEERDYLYKEYAKDPHMRLNLGIRRRLAPLMNNRRDRIQLMNSLLFSLAGTPVIYYGDELGMGDNIFLGDRNGVRTPMQWSGSLPNGGFSQADPSKLCAPLIVDPICGYPLVNVEFQQSDPESLLRAMRNRHPVFGRGTMTLLLPDNRKILAYLRQDQQETILVVANLSVYAQPVSLDLSQFQGYTPLEMFGQTPFPVIGEGPYFLSLGRYNFYWFELQPASPSPAGRGLG
jgi:maltose alpha-D-glucosyltransferase/alpha-amylase